MESGEDRYGGCSMIKFKPRSFWISGEEISATMMRGEIDTVTAAVRLLVPDMQFYKCSRGGYWGLRRCEFSTPCLFHVEQNVKQKIQHPA